MTETIRVDDLTFVVKRSERRKTVGVTVERDASLVAHLPKDADLGRASELIRTRLVWVHQKLANHKDVGRESVFRQPEFVDGEGFHFLGKHYRLKLVDVGPAGPPTPTVRFEGDKLLFRREQVAAGDKRIAEYYTRAAHPGEQRTGLAGRGALRDLGADGLEVAQSRRRPRPEPYAASLADDVDPGARGRRRGAAQGASAAA